MLIIALKSAPATNAFPSPVRMITRTLSSFPVPEKRQEVQKQLRVKRIHRRGRLTLSKATSSAISSKVYYRPFV
jgi:hypothetical protein